MLAVTHTERADAIDEMLDALREADRLTARAISIAADLMPTGVIERATGLPTEFVLRLRARRSTKEARRLSEAAATLRGMPLTTAAFASGMLSWDEVRFDRVGGARDHPRAARDHRRARRRGADSLHRHGGLDRWGLR